MVHGYWLLCHLCSQQPIGNLPLDHRFLLLSARHKDPYIALHLEAPELGTVAIPRRLRLRVRTRWKAATSLTLLPWHICPGTVNKSQGRQASSLSSVPSTPGQV